MIKASFISNSKSYLGNKIFKENENQIFFHLLKKRLKNIDIDLSTDDINKPNQSKINIYFDVHNKFVSNNTFDILIAFESLAVLPKNADKKIFQNFDLVFTWNNDLIDNKTVFPLCYSSNFNFKTKNETFEKRKLMCNISSNKFSTHEDELYTKRSKLIRYLNNSVDDFHLYGYDWEIMPQNIFLFDIYSYLMKNKYIFKLYKISSKYLPKSFFFNFNNYEGPTNYKIRTLGNYKFNLCFENIYNSNGYISEKIIDCFLANTVPIYLGYNKISELIPNELFIDYRDFKSPSELIKFIKNFSEEDYNKFKKKVEIFLNSSISSNFEVNHNVNEFIQTFKKFF